MVAKRDDVADSGMGSNPDAGNGEGLTEGFGGEATRVVPDDAPSSRWDRNAQDEDALVADGPEES
ncbi:hypothetical protein FBY41_3847 [Humibacillus xanthopallidus]|uniref:Uncharacterized protein n=1 Tax=Humibacillus xanthopallidus TaxID=412689 RepID=A0A543HJL5_9MICO|nr:hypothetical protein FBY41_3847 [Humibacillus xanthopallidus]